ncbi:hypothetical protein B4N89_20650 [Embleya scabrispora]|uniref:FtsK domain-containing protein n=1 Tax=Embleya scabrispora TaxID=159449 RepID=A0A1T3P239_9ACTN|nr:hypothetical protein [Embleya scabrispora]OPC83025.1 hypothetical protein B4N89_20650 [Embleya scabrispora]
MAALQQRAAERALSTVAPYVPAWLATPATYGLAHAAHTAWHDQPGPAMASALLAAAVTWGTSHITPTSAPLWRAHATATVGLATGGIALSAAIDPTSPGALSAWAILGIATPLSWTIRRITRNGGTTSDGPKALTAGDSGLAAQVRALKGVEIGPPAVEGGRVKAPLHVVSPEGDIERVQDATRTIAAALGVGRNSVRVQADPDDAGRAELIVVPRDHLKHTIPWPGPSAPGGSIGDGFAVGLYEDGIPAVFWLNGDPEAGRNATHLGVFGMNGSGKSSGGEVTWADLLTRRDACLWLGDPVKGEQTLGAVRAGGDWVVTDTAGCRDQIRALPDVIAARADQLGRWGHKQWTPDVFETHDMPALVVWWEEAAKLFRDEIGEDITGLLETARSAGVFIVISLQRPSVGIMSGDDREQIGATWCFGVKGSTTAKMALPPEVRAAGAAPEAWANRRAGYAYLVAPGVDEERYATPMRAYRITAEQLAEAVEGYAEIRASLDAVSAAAAGGAYANRHRDATTTTMPAPRQGPAVIVRDTDRLDLPVNHEPDLPEPDVDAPIEVPTTPSITFARPATQEMPREQAVALLRETIVEMNRAGRTEFRPHDLRDVRARVGRARTWVTGELQALVKAGLLEDDGRGNYRIRDLVPA